MSKTWSPLAAPPVPPIEELVYGSGGEPEWHITVNLIDSVYTIWQQVRERHPELRINQDMVADHLIWMGWLVHDYCLGEFELAFKDDELGKMYRFVFTEPSGVIRGAGPQVRLLWPFRWGIQLKWRLRRFRSTKLHKVTLILRERTYQGMCSMAEAYGMNRTEMINRTVKVGGYADMQLSSGRSFCVRKPGTEVWRQARLS